MEYKICSYPKAQCSFRCGTTDTVMLVRKDDVREIDGVFIENKDGCTYGAYHFEEKIVALCSNRELCPIWKAITSQYIMNQFYTNELYICDQIEKIVFRENLQSEETMFKLREWFKCLRKRMKRYKDSEQYIEKFKSRLTDRYNLWMENTRHLELTT